MKIYSVLFAIGVFLISCKKKEDTIFSASVFLDSRQTATQTFTVQAGQPINITGEKGFQVIHDGFFKDFSGNVVTGNVTVSLKEVTKKSEAIYNRLLTEADGDTILKSAGMFLLFFSQNGQTVYPDNQAQIVVPSISAPDITMKLYSQEYVSFEPSDSSLYTTYTWTNGVGGDDSCSNVSFTSSSYNVINCFVDPTLNWVNLDVPIYSQPITTVEVVTYEYIFNAIVLMVFDNYNTVTHFYQNFNTYTFSRTNVPVGEPVKIIVIGNSGNEAVFGKYEGVVTQDMSVSITVNEITEENLEAELNALD